MISPLRIVFTKHVELKEGIIHEASDAGVGVGGGEHHPIEARAAAGELAQHSLSQSPVHDEKVAGDEGEPGRAVVEDQRPGVDRLAYSPGPGRGWPVARHLNGVAPTLEQIHARGSGAQGTPGQCAVAREQGIVQQEIFLQAEDAGLIEEEWRVVDEVPEELGTEDLDIPVDVGPGRGNVAVHQGLTRQGLPVPGSLEEHAPGPDHHPRPVRSGHAVDEYGGALPPRLLGDPDHLENLPGRGGAAGRHGQADELAADRFHEGCVFRIGGASKVEHVFQADPFHQELQQRPARICGAVEKAGLDLAEVFYREAQTL